MGFLRTPVEFRVFDGIRPDDFAFPNGETPPTVATEKVTVPARSYSWQPLSCPALAAGAHQGMLQVGGAGKLDIDLDVGPGRRQGVG